MSGFRATIPARRPSGVPTRGVCVRAMCLGIHVCLYLSVPSAFLGMRGRPTRAGPGLHAAHVVRRLLHGVLGCASGSLDCVLGRLYVSRYADQ